MLDFAADPVQARVLESRSRRVLLNCTRQWGKSTIAAVKAVHEAWTQESSLSLVVSPSARQSAELVRKAAEFVRRLDVPVKRGGDQDISLELPNGARIVGLPGNETTVRGFSAVSLIVVDEAARVSEGLYHAVRPMLAVSNGALWLMSTPFAKRGFFWEAWEHGGAEWERVRATAHECPRISRKFLNEEMAAMGEGRFRQEYLCEFGEPEDGVFAAEWIERATRKDLEPLRIG